MADYSSHRDQMGSAGGKQALVRAPSDGSASMMAEIVVPDSYLGFVRLLIFLYTGRSMQRGARTGVLTATPTLRVL